MEFGERRQLVPRVYSPQGEKLVRSVHLSEGCQHSCVLPARHWRERAERTRVDTPPTGGPNTLVFLHGAEYTRGTRCPLAELHWLLITATITRVVSYSNATRVDTDFIFTAGYKKLSGAKTTILVTFDHACGY